MARVRKIWTEQEDVFLHKHYPSKGALWCSKRLKTFETRVQQRVAYLKIASGRAWYPKDIAILENNYPSKGAAWCAAKMGRSLNNIKSKASRLKLKVLIRSDGSKPNGYWTFDRCHEDAKPHKTIGDWQSSGSGGYSAASQRGYVPKIKALVKFETLGNMEKRFVYVYEFADKSVYVGLTCHLQNRHAQHLKSKRFTKEKVGVAFEKKIITKNPIAVSRAAELEGTIIKEYESDGWTILNKASAGGLGGRGAAKNIEEYVTSCAKQCKTKKEFEARFNGAYQAAHRLGILNQISTHMAVLRRRLSDKELIAIASKYPTPAALKKADSSAYGTIYARGLKSLAFKHMVSSNKPRGHWQIRENLQKDALLYKTRTEWIRKSPGAYHSARIKPYFDEITAHMPPHAGYEFKNR